MWQRNAAVAHSGCSLRMVQKRPWAGVALVRIGDGPSFTRALARNVSKVGVACRSVLRSENWAGALVAAGGLDQKIRFIINIMTTRNRMVMMPPARRKSGTR
jgi:hypothetical protein